MITREASRWQPSGTWISQQHDYSHHNVEKSVVKVEKPELNNLILATVNIICLLPIKSWRHLGPWGSTVWLGKKLIQLSDFSLI